MDVVFCEMAPCLSFFYIIHIGYYIACSSLDWLAVFFFSFFFVCLSNAVFHSCVRDNLAFRVYFQDWELLFFFFFLLLACESSSLLTLWFIRDIFIINITNNDDNMMAAVIVILLKREIGRW